VLALTNKCSRWFTNQRRFLDIRRIDADVRSPPSRWSVGRDPGCWVV